MKRKSLLKQTFVTLPFLLLCLIVFSSCKESETSAPAVTPPVVVAPPADLVAGTWADLFVANFDAGSDLTNWQAANRADYNSKNCLYVSSANSIKELDGKSSLCITAVKVGTDKYQSGNLETKDKFQPANNEELHFSASIKLLAQDSMGVFKGFSETYGAWPAFWTVKGDGWPTRGEIDIMETYSYGSGKPTRMASNLFYGLSPNVNLLNNKLEKPMTYTEGWHTYELFWKNLAGKITLTIMLDGVTTATYTDESMAELQLQNFGEHTMVLNLNVGDNYGIFDNTKINLFSKTLMYVDFAKVEKRIYK
jgi:beta-glucanase (GH16 family)